MTEVRYTMIRSLNGEIEDIIDHCKQDKHLNVVEFMNQVNEQDKAFKELKEENRELNQVNIELYRKLAKINRLLEKWNQRKLTAKQFPVVSIIMTELEVILNE